MKKVLAILFGLLFFTSSVFASEFDKAVGLDFSFNGISPNFYMIKDHFEFESGISFMKQNIITESYTLSPSVFAAYTADIGHSDVRFAIGFSDSLIFGYDNPDFSFGNLLSIYMRMSKPLDARMELGGIMFIPMHYLNISTDPAEFSNKLPSGELLFYGLTMFTFEVRYYLGGL